MLEHETKERREEDIREPEVSDVKARVFNKKRTPRNKALIANDKEEAWLSMHGATR